MAVKVKAITKFVKGSARKARIPADIVRGMKAVDAIVLLKYMPKRAALDVGKTVESAVANAVNNNKLNADDLVISEIMIDDAKSTRRFKPGSKGGYHKFERKTCHINVVLEAREPEVKEVKSKKISKKETKKEEVTVNDAEIVENTTNKAE